MKRQSIPFQQLLERVLPIDRLPARDRERVSAALRGGDPHEIESVTLQILERLESLGLMRHVEDVLRGDEKIRRYRDLTTGNTVALRLPAGDEDEGIYRIPLPLREWRGATSLDEVRTLFSLYNKILTSDSKLLRGPADVLRQIMTTARLVLQCERVAFWSPVHGNEPPLTDIVSRPYDEDLSRDWVLDRRCLVYLPELPADINPDTGVLENEFHSLALIPIGDESQTVFGVLEAWSVRPRFFDSNRQGLLSLLSEFATDVLKRSEILGTLVFVDAATQVYNRAYFNLQLENEIARARREEHSLALAIADIDDFKSFNTRYGFEGGNQVLAKTASRLKENVRPFDSVARWGGEEFAIILTAPVSPDDARMVCERLRSAMEQSMFEVVGMSGESVATRITISIGGAMFPGDGESSQDLWRAANTSLLEAKRRGKNRALFAGDLPESPPEA